MPKKTRTSLPEEALKYFAEQGRRGAKIRAENLNPKERSAIAKKAADKRWAEEKKRRKQG